MAPRIFLSHTDRTALDREATTAILVELRRFGIEVWIDRENPPPPSTPEQEAEGPTPANPLFNHIVDALAASDAVLYVMSQSSFSSEYVRLEFDPRVIHKEFQTLHPDIAPEELPFFVGVVGSIQNPSHLWASLIDQFPGHILDLTGGAQTPLLLPATLNAIIAKIAPDYLLPLDPVSSFLIRNDIEAEADNAPGCPQGVPPSTWRQLENCLGLGPLFTGSHSLVDESQLQYALHAMGRAARIDPGIQAPFTERLDLLSALWSANIMLRSETLRVQNGHDLPVEYSFPNIMDMLQPDFNNMDNLLASVCLQFGFGLVSSTMATDLDTADNLLWTVEQYFNAVGAWPLAALATLLRHRAGTSIGDIQLMLPAKVIDAFHKLQLNPELPDLGQLHHTLLDTVFPGPRLEATAQYRAATKSWRKSMQKAGSQFASANIGYAKPGEAKMNPEYWQRVGPDD